LEGEISPLHDMALGGLFLNNLILFQQSLGIIGALFGVLEEVHAE
jgi:hypothetical protein